MILSFDIEEHDRIEAAYGLDIDHALRVEYAERMESATRRLLDQLARHQTLATFFIVGEIARTHPHLVRDIHAAGHEIASHSHAHENIHRLTPVAFHHDLVASKDGLEQLIGEPIVGFRAPTFSITRRTAWAIDILAEAGFRYDSSIFPVRHDRYGVVDAPRTPFIVTGNQHSLIELPPATLKLGSYHLPVAGGGYFRLFPPALMRWGIAQQQRLPGGVAMLYFHPWEFDVGQPRLPLKRLSRWRTYVGIRQTTARLDALLQRYRFQRAIDIVESLREDELSRFLLGDSRNASIKSVESAQLANVRE